MIEPTEIDETRLNGHGTPSTNGHGTQPRALGLSRSRFTPWLVTPVAEPVRVPTIPATRVPYRYALAKRITDVVIASVALVLSLPLQALIAALIAADSPGPVIFRQQRVGRGGKLFTFYKFRTMHADARERFPELYAYEYTPEQIETMCFKLPYDPRLTRVGRRLRRTSLDELPNLVNVIRGEMTLVGPRPEIPEMLRYYRPDQLAKFAVKPGLTGLAQVTGRNILRFQETIAKDLEYVQQCSYRFELEILVRTLVVVIGRAGAL